MFCCWLLLSILFHHHLKIAESSVFSPFPGCLELRKHGTSSADQGAKLGATGVTIHSHALGHFRKFFSSIEVLD